MRCFRLVLSLCVQKKKVLTAYQIFYKEYRNSILEEHPGLGETFIIIISSPACVQIRYWTLISVGRSSCLHYRTAVFKSTEGFCHRTDQQNQTLRLFSSYSELILLVRGVKYL